MLQLSVLVLLIFLYSIEMAPGTSSQVDLVDMDKMVSSMTIEINAFWSAYESDNGNKPFLLQRVPQHIFQLDRQSYEPIILSIGPHHHGGLDLVAMEKEKWKCLDYILKLNREVNLQDYIRAIHKLEKKVRNCYTEVIKMDKTKFLRMLLLDSCFILVKVDGTVTAELALKSENTGVVIQNTADMDGEEFVKSGQVTESVSATHGHASENVVLEIELAETSSREMETEDNKRKRDQNSECLYDQSAVGDWYSNFVWHDIFLLENQIPFFVFETVYDIVISKGITKVLLRDKIVECVEDILRQFPIGIEEFSRPQNFHHLLHLCHMYFRPTHKLIIDRHQHQPKVLYLHHLVHLGKKYFGVIPGQEESEQHLLHRPLDDCFQAGQLPTRWRQAIQYHEAGVELKKREYSSCHRHSLLDIKFSDGVVEVPCFPIDENTESLFKNLIAFEQTNPQFGNDITAYIIFMSQFVSTVEDATLLTQRGILIHFF
ncbi:hypothetical protein SORBI_3006G239700 [Sorghum bicolor]|jgi:hypothetical protein|uniref:Uncharacterized protein n=2 Tax=Sorghum bicolor TaxID=4558 RepID=A0A1Z5RFC1_SORBI|nr:hypothetical protein SORBI_3006G239700 [Sorghum bicolor]